MKQKKHKKLFYFILIDFLLFIGKFLNLINILQILLLTILIFLMNKGNVKAQHHIREELHDQDLFIVADFNKIAQPHRIFERAAIVGSGDGETTVAPTSGQTVLTTTTKAKTDEKKKNNVILIVALSAGALLATACLICTASAFIAFVRRRRMRIRPREEEQPATEADRSNKSSAKRNTSKSSSRNSSSKSQKSSKPSSSNWARTMESC
jgi:hypothetical protein